jgi:hypothetical protein
MSASRKSKLSRTRVNHGVCLVQNVSSDNLVLILPVAMAIVGRAFSAINFVKNRLRNRIFMGVI